MTGSDIMPYLFLVATAVCLTVMSLLRKEYDRRTTGDGFASFTFIGITYIAVLLFAILYFLFTRSFTSFVAVDAVTVLLAFGFALATFITTIICIVGASYGSVSIIVVFANLGTVTLSSIYGFIFDSEKNQASVFTWIGLALVLAIVVLNFVEGGKEKRAVEKSKKLIYKILCFVVFFTNGIALVIYSILTKYRSEVGSWNFISLYSLICVLLAALCIGVLLLKQKVGHEKKAARLRVSRVSLILIGVYAVFFLLGELMSLANTKTIPIIIHAPLSFAIPVIMLTVGECVIYKTPITKSMIIKSVLALAGSIFFVL